MVSLVAAHLLMNDAGVDGMEGYTQYDDYKRAPQGPGLLEEEPGSEEGQQNAAAAYVPPEV